MATEHVAITDGNGTTTSERHEPKGASIATSGQVYVSDGAASGAWTTVLDPYVVTAEIDDVSTASSTWVVAPYAGTIEKVYTVLHGTIATSDATITTEIAGVGVTGGDVTIAYSGSAAGDVDNNTPSANNTVSAGQAIEVITNGASTTTARVTVSLLIQRTA